MPKVRRQLALGERTPPTEEVQGSRKMKRRAVPLHEAQGGDARAEKV